MQKKKEARSRLPGILLVILTVLSLKLILAFGSFMGDGPPHTLLTTPVVMAQDTTKKPAKNPPANATAGKDAPAQPAPSQNQLPPASDVAGTAAYLEKREAELKLKEEALKQKEEYLNQMSKDIEKKLNDLIVVQKEVQAYRAQQEDSQSAKARILVKIYETMKPKEAAKLMENLDDKLVVTIISAMGANEAAAILSNMDVKKAAKISEVLSNNK